VPRLAEFSPITMPVYYEANNVLTIIVIPFEVTMNKSTSMTTTDRARRGP